MADDSSESRLPEEVKKECDIIMRIDDSSVFKKVPTSQTWRKSFPNHPNLKKEVEFMYLDPYLEHAAAEGVEAHKMLKLLNYSLAVEYAKNISKLAKIYFPNLSTSTKADMNGTLGTIALVQVEDEIADVKTDYAKTKNLGIAVIPPMESAHTTRQAIQAFVYAVGTEILKMPTCVENYCAMNPPSEDTITCHLCPYCYEKVVNILQFVPSDRSAKLAVLYGDLGLTKEQEWEKKFLAIIKERLEYDASNKRRRSGVSRLAEAPPIESPRKRLKTTRDPEPEPDEENTIDAPSPIPEADDEAAVETTTRSPRRSSLSKPSTATAKTGKSTSGTPVPPSTAPPRVRASSNRATVEATPEPSVTGEASNDSRTRRREDSGPTNGVTLVATTNNTDEEKWRDAVSTFLDAQNAGRRINNRNLQYCLIQLLAHLKTDTDEDFNEASILADVKRHRMHLTKR